MPDDTLRFLIHETGDEAFRLEFAWASQLRLNAVDDFLDEAWVELGVRRISDLVERVAACLDV